MLELPLGSLLRDLARGDSGAQLYAAPDEHVDVSLSIGLTGVPIAGRKPFAILGFAACRVSGTGAGGEQQGKQQGAAGHVAASWADSAPAPAAVLRSRSRGAAGKCALHQPA